MSEKLRIFHACDPHGSQMTWEKMCKAPEVFKADVAMMCGDLTGKAILPVIQEKEDRWYARPHGDKKEFKKKKDVDRFMKFYNDTGMYAKIFTPEELQKLQETPGAIKELFEQLMEERIREWLDMAQEKIPENVEYRIRSKDGREFWVILNVRYVYEDGDPKRATVVAHDITDRKRMEQELRSSEDRLRILFEYAPDGYYLSDLKGTFIDGNKAYNTFSWPVLSIFFTLLIH